MASPELTRLLTFAMAVCLSSSSFADEQAAERTFTLKVLPLLKTKCFVCHGDDPQDLKGEFDVRTREGLLKGGESAEPSLVPGKPAESPLYLAVLWEGLEMPPKENDRLTKQETELIREWIAGGIPGRMPRRNSRSRSRSGPSSRMRTASSCRQAEALLRPGLTGATAARTSGAPADPES